MLLLVNEPSAGVYYGSVVAAPYAKQIFSGIFQAKNIKSQDEQQKQKEYVEMPNLVGLSLVEACETLVSMGLNYELDGEGGMVVAQFPPTGTVLEKYSTVQISVANE